MARSPIDRGYGGPVATPGLGWATGPGGGGYDPSRGSTPGQYGALSQYGGDMSRLREAGPSGGGTSAPGGGTGNGLAGLIGSLRGIGAGGGIGSAGVGTPWTPDPIGGPANAMARPTFEGASFSGAGTPLGQRGGGGSAKAMNAHRAAMAAADATPHVGTTMPGIVGDPGPGLGTMPARHAPYGGTPWSGTAAGTGVASGLGAGGGSSDAGGPGGLALPSSPGLPGAGAGSGMDTGMTRHAPYGGGGAFGPAAGTGVAIGDGGLQGLISRRGRQATQEYTP